MVSAVTADICSFTNRRSASVSVGCRGSGWSARPNDDDFVNWSVTDVCSRRRRPALPASENVWGITESIAYFENLIEFCAWTGWQLCVRVVCPSVNTYVCAWSGGGILWLACHSLLVLWYILYMECLASVLSRCWLGGRKGIRPVKSQRVVGCWCGCLSEARCRLAYGPADATATHCLLLQ